MTSTATNGKKITRDDVEAAFSRLLGEGQVEAQSVASQVVVLAAAAALGVIAIAYLAGRRRGRRRSAIVEFRRI